MSLGVATKRHALRDFPGSISSTGWSKCEGKSEISHEVCTDGGVGPEFPNCRRGIFLSPCVADGNLRDAGFTRAAKALEVLYQIAFGSKLIRPVDWPASSLFSQTSYAELWHRRTKGQTPAAYFHRCRKDPPLLAAASRP